MNEHYYTKQPTSQLKERIIKVILRGRTFEFFTGSGTFSPKKIDLGSKLLIEKAEIMPGMSVLDLGCGYGPIGIAIAKTLGNAVITMTDTNRRAVQFARKNAKHNNVKVTIKAGEFYQPVDDQKFDVILLNPPQAAGNRIIFRMIEEAKDHLKQTGTLQLVARHQKGGKTIERKMKEVFGNTRHVAKQSGYRIYLSVNS